MTSYMPHISPRGKEGNVKSQITEETEGNQCLLGLCFVAAAVFDASYTLSLQPWQQPCKVGLHFTEGTTASQSSALITAQAAGYWENQRSNPGLSCLKNKGKFLNVTDFCCCTWT